MKRILIATVFLGSLSFQPGKANPLPPYEIVYIKAFPPQIGLSLFEPTDLSGDTIFTTSGIAIIDSGVIAEGYRYDPFILDSSNTSGFALNADADSVRVNISGEIWSLAGPEEWGTLGIDPPPILGHYIEQDIYNVPPWYYFNVFCLDDADPDQGRTNVIINEVNAHGTWRDGANFVELYNEGSDEISLAGWKIVCDTILNLPGDATIHAHGFYVIDEASFPASFDMDLAGDNIYLIDADSDLVDQVGWSSDHGEDVSFMRFPDGDTLPQEWNSAFWGFDDASSFSFEDGFPSRGAPNRYFSPGLKVIGIRCDTAYCTANISWTNPIWLSVFTDAILRRSTDSFPQTPYDGDIIYEGPGQWCSDRDITPGQTYYYTVFARTSCGDYSEPDSESQISAYFPSVGIEDNPIPKRAALLECYPNPFNVSTMIRYGLAESGQARLTIYNLAGQRVAILRDSNQEGGEHSVVWDGSGLSSGIYFARLESGSTERSIKVTLLK
jgi:hypothetical protein